MSWLRPAATATAPTTQERQRWQRAQHAGRRWAVWGVLLGALGAALANAPAQWLADALHQASAQRLLLADARGSLWTGSAVLVLTGGAGSRDAAALPGRLQWRLRPDWRGLALAAQQDCCINGDLKLHWQPGWGGYTLALAGAGCARPRPAGDRVGVRGDAPIPPALASPHPSPRPPAGEGELPPAGKVELPRAGEGELPQAGAGELPQAGEGELPRAGAGERPDCAEPGVIGHWPAAWLAGLGTPWNTLQLGGLLQLASPGLRLQSVQGRLRLDGALALELQGMSSRLSPLPVLGSYRLGLQSQPAGGESATLRLDTLDGALRLSGSGQWTGARLRFRGDAQAADGQAAALANLLNIIGRRQGALSIISIG